MQKQRNNRRLMSGDPSLDRVLAKQSFAARLSARTGKVSIRMSLRLTRSMRVLAGRLIALAYLFCVLSPGVALAFGNGPEACFDDGIAPMAAAHQGIAHREIASLEMMAQMRADGGQHDHGGLHLHHHHDVAHEDVAAPVGHHDHHGKMPGACCAALCVVGIAVDLPSLTAPTRMASGQVLSGEQSLVSRAPPLLYRPPITLV
jgi:hypothetical protein